MKNSSDCECEDCSNSFLKKKKEKVLQFKVKEFTVSSTVFFELSCCFLASFISNINDSEICKRIK